MTLTILLQSRTALEIRTRRHINVDECRSPPQIRPLRPERIDPKMVSLSRSQPEGQVDVEVGRGLFGIASCQASQRTPA
jgi:hypothetical protein